MTDQQIQWLNSEGRTLVDVREPHELLEIKARDAINIPLGDLAGKIQAMQDAPKPILLFCHSGKRSGMAEALLQTYGVDDVHNIGGVEEVIAVQQV